MFCIFYHNFFKEDIVIFPLPQTEHHKPYNQGATIKAYNTRKCWRIKKGKILTELLYHMENFQVKY